MAEKKQPKRRKRADGELSRERILDAATEISAERGYEGTSIALVSAKCGLPASSIYWHFKDKDDLIAAVIERSFGTWLSAWQVPEEGTAQGRAVSVAAQVAKALLDSPDFIRLGLMLALEPVAVERKRSLLVLDTAVDGGAATLYERLGFTLTGEIPDYAFKPHGGLTGTLIYWKRIGSDEAPGLS